MGRSLEAFAAYHRKKETLVDYLQVASAGLALLRRNLDVPNAPTLLGSLVDACGIKHWAEGKHYNNALEKVDASISALADLGIIQQVAAFDVFSRSLIQDVTRFSSQARQRFAPLGHDHHLLKLSPAHRWVSAHCCNDVVGRLNSLSSRLDELQVWIGWSPSGRLSPTLVLFDLIRSVRNRIAHDDGIVGSDLEELSGSREIANALGAFRREYARADFPALPKFKRGRPLNLSTVHSILFGAFLYEIAKEMNAYAVSLLNDDEFIDMAFYYSCLIDEHPFRTLRHRSVENRVRYFLASRYYRKENAPSIDAVRRRLTTQQVQSNGRASTTLWRIALARHEEILLE